MVDLKKILNEKFYNKLNSDLKKNLIYFYNKKKNFIENFFI